MPSTGGGGSLFWKPAASVSASASTSTNASSRKRRSVNTRDNAYPYNNQNNNLIRDDNDHSHGSDNVNVPAIHLYPTRRNNNMTIQQQRMLLPIYKHKRQITYAVEKHGVTIIVGATGSGKSTQIPQFLLEAGWAQHGFQIVCTQPRRIAAISLAQRVQQETNDSNSIGYAVRFDDTTKHGVTKIKYATDGILLREATLHDPLLSRYSVVICDEAHERQLNSDLLLGLLKKIRRQRPDLRLVICSATIDAEAFLNFFIPPSDRPEKHHEQQEQQHSQTNDNQKKRSRWGAKVGDKNHHPKELQQQDQNQQQEKQQDHENRGTIISVDGRQYAVETFFAERPFSNYLQATVDTCWKIHRNEGPGGVLCFLPSSQDVDAALRMTEQVFDGDDLHEVEFLPIYGSLPQYMQARIFQPPTPLSASSKSSRSGKKHKRNTSGAATKRRFIFATNIAETSISVPDICFVVDSGLVKLPYYDPITAMERLIVCPISQASSRQRAGRAGRLSPGKCFCLYTEKYYTDKLQAQTAPEMLRTNLTSLVLTLKALGVDNILTFDFMDVPSIDCISHALETLYALGAMDAKTNLTTMGMDLATFPTEPRVSRMLLESIAEGCTWEVLAVASALQVRDLLHRPKSSNNNSASHQKMIDYQESVGEFADPSGDHVTFANLLSEAEDGNWTEEESREKFVHYASLRRAIEIRRQLAKFLRKFGSIHAMGITDGDGTLRSRAVRRCVTAGFFFNVAKLQSDGRYYTLRKDILVTPSVSSVFSTHGGLMNTEYIIFGETIDGSRGGIELNSVSTVEAKWLRELAPHYWDS